MSIYLEQSAVMTDSLHKQLLDQLKTGVLLLDSKLQPIYPEPGR